MRVDDVFIHSSTHSSVRSFVLSSFFLSFFLSFLSQVSFFLSLCFRLLFLCFYLFVSIHEFVICVLTFVYLFSGVGGSCRNTGEKDIRRHVVVLQKNNITFSVVSSLACPLLSCL